MHTFFAIGDSDKNLIIYVTLTYFDVKTKL